MASKIPCDIIYKGDKYTPEKFRKYIRNNADEFIEHVYEGEMPVDTAKKIAEFDELLDAKTGIQTVDIPKETNQELEKLSNELTKEESDIVDGFAGTLESQRNIRTGEDTGVNQENEPTRIGRGDTETVKQATETEAQPEGQGGELRQEPVSESERGKSTEGVTAKELMPAIEVNGKIYEGANHGDAMDNARAVGEDVPDWRTPEGDKWRTENGMFKEQSTGKLLNREQADSKYGVSRTSELKTQKQAPKDKAIKELVKEIKSKILTHAIGIKMGANEMIGTYLSTEKENRYAKRAKEVKKAKVNIKNPYEIKDSSELVKLQNAVLEQAKAKYVKDNPSIKKSGFWDEFKSAKHFDEDVLSAIPDFQKYVASEVTNKLRSMGYDSAYLRESPNNEGMLVVFDRNNVSLEKDKPVVITKKFLREEKARLRSEQGKAPIKGNVDVMNAAKKYKEAVKSFAPTNISEYVSNWLAAGGKINSADFANEVHGINTSEYADSKLHGSNEPLLGTITANLAEQFEKETGLTASESEIRNELFEQLNDNETKTDLQQKIIKLNDERQFAEEHGMSKAALEEAQHLYEEEQAFIKLYGLDRATEETERAFDEADTMPLSQEEIEQLASEFDNENIPNEIINQRTEGENDAENKSYQKAEAEHSQKVAELSRQIEGNKQARRNRVAQLEKGLKPTESLFGKTKEASPLGIDISPDTSKENLDRALADFDKTDADLRKQKEDLIAGKEKFIQDRIDADRAQGEMKFQFESANEPMTIKKLFAAIARVKKLFPNVEVTTDSGEWKDALAKISKETGLGMDELNKPTNATENLGKDITKTPNGFIYKGKLYLNPDMSKIRTDTVAHEAQHLANEVMKNKAPHIWNRGVKLALQEGAIEKLRELYPHLKTDADIADEFIADATGKRVADLEKELEGQGIAMNVINSITDWVRQAKDWINEKLGLNANETFGEFIDRAARTQLRGEKIGDVIPTDEAKLQKGYVAPPTKEEEEAMFYGSKPTDTRFINHKNLDGVKAEFLPEAASSYFNETRDKLIGSLRKVGLWEKIPVTKEIRGENVEIGSKRKEITPEMEQKGIDTLRGSINDMLRDIETKLHTASGDNKKSFQLSLERLRDELSSPEKIPVLREIFKALTGQSDLFNTTQSKEGATIFDADGVEDRELTSAQREAKKFFSDVAQTNMQADHITKTDGAVMFGDGTFVPKNEVSRVSVAETTPWQAKLTKLKSIPFAGKAVAALEGYSKMTSSVLPFGKLLTGEAKGMIHEAVKALSRADGKRHRLVTDANKLAEALFKKLEKSSLTLNPLKTIDEVEYNDINAIVGRNIVEGGKKVTDEDLMPIYMTLRQRDANKAYFAGEREAARLKPELEATKAELEKLQATDRTKLDKEQLNDLDKNIEAVEKDILEQNGKISELEKKGQSFRLEDGTQLKINSEDFGKIREYITEKYGKEIEGWDKATEMLHDYVSQAFKTDNGVTLPKIEKYYPLIHGKGGEKVADYATPERFVEDFRSGKYRAVSPENEDYLAVPAVKAMQGYINTAAKYAAYNIPMRNMDAVMGGLEGNVDKSYQEWWNKTKKVANDPRSISGVVGEMGEFEKKVFANFSTAVLGLNPFIPPKEISAIFLGTNVIPAKYLAPQAKTLAGDLGKLLKSFNPASLRTYDATEKEMMAHNDMANMRLTNGVTDVAELSKEMSKMRLPFTDKVVDLSKTTEPMLMAHRMVQKAYWLSAKDWVSAEFPNLKGDDYWEKVGDIYENATLSTQPAIDTFNSPSFRKETNPLTRALSLYAGQGFVNMNTLIGKSIDVANHPESVQAKIALAQTAANVFVVNATLLTAIDLSRPGAGKKKDEEFFYLLRNAGKSVPIFSPIFDAVLNKYQSPAFGYGVDLPIFEVTNDLADGIASLAKGKYDKGMDDFIRLSAEYNGLPVTPYETGKKLIK